MFIADADLTQALADILKVADVADLPGNWLNIVTASNLAAYNDIQSALLVRGLTAAQIDTWDRGDEFERDIGLFWCLVKGGGLHNYDPTYIKMLDRRPEMKTVAVLSGGMPVGSSPATTDSAVGHGKLSTHGDSVRLRQHRHGHCRPVDW